MTRKAKSKAARLTRRSFTAGLGAAGIVAGTAPFNIVRAAGPAQGRRAAAALGRAGGHRPGLQRGVEITNGILKDLGLPELQIMNADTETSVDVARSRRREADRRRCQLLTGAFDSGASTAIAQVAEQKGIPYVINIAAHRRSPSRATSSCSATSRPGR